MKNNSSTKSNRHIVAKVSILLLVLMLAVTAVVLLTPSHSKNEPFSQNYIPKLGRLADTTVDSNTSVTGTIKNSDDINSLVSSSPYEALQLQISISIVDSSDTSYSGTGIILGRVAGSGNPATIAVDGTKLATENNPSNISSETYTVTLKAWYVAVTSGTIPEIEVDPSSVNESSAVSNIFSDTFDIVYSFAKLDAPDISIDWN